MKTDKIFTLEMVEKLVKNAYEVGFCDGIDSSEIYRTDYSKADADDFWNKNVANWISDEISYIL